MNTIRDMDINTIFFSLIMLTPVGIMLTSFFSFHVGRVIYLTLLEKLDRRSKLRYKLVEIQRKTYEVNNIYSATGFLVIMIVVTLALFVLQAIGG